jgi:hypothetical protein
MIGKSHLLQTLAGFQPFTLRQRRVRQMMKQVLNAIKIVDDVGP